MIKLEIQQIPTKGHRLEPYIYKVVFDAGYDEVKAKETRRELHQAQLAVSGIIAKIKELHDEGEICQILHGILQKSMKEGGD